MNKDQVKGRIRKAKGKAKEVAGKLLHKPKLTAKGKLQKAAGTVQATYGDLKSVATKRAIAANRTVEKKARVVKKRVVARKPK